MLSIVLLQIIRIDSDITDIGVDVTGIHVFVLSIFAIINSSDVTDIDT